MNRLVEMDEFLKYYAKIYMQNPGIDINSNSIYSGLKDYQYSDSEIKNASAEETVTNVLNYYKNSSNLNVWISEMQPGFVQFRSKNATADDINSLKLYVSVPKEHYEESVKQIFDYIDTNNITSCSKIARKVRADDIVLRLSNKEEALKVIDYINNNKFLKSVARQTNPFLFREGVVGIGYDELYSYNAIVSEIVSNYLNELKANNNLKHASVQDFGNFINKFYQDRFVNCDKITDVDNIEMVRDYGSRHSSKGAAILNAEKIIRVLNNSVHDNIDIKSFMQFYDHAKDKNYNEQYTEYYNQTYNRVIEQQNLLREEQNKQVNKSNERVVSSKEIFDNYIDYALQKYKSTEVVAKYLMSYQNGHVNAITRDNGFRDLFNDMVLSSDVSKFTNNDIESYVASRITNVNSVNPYNVFLASCYDTIVKYGVPQVFFAIDAAKKGDYKYFTNGTNNNREMLKQYIDPNMIDQYCAYYLQTKGINQVGTDLMGQFINEFNNAEIESVRGKNL